MMASARANRSPKRTKAGKMDLRPYGFCCRPDLNPPNYGRKLRGQGSLESLHSLHECPALRLLTEEVVPRPPGPTDSELSLAEQQASGALALGGTSAHGATMPTESELDLMIDEERRRRQEEYERNMDRWAELGRQRLEREATRKILCLAPCWYTEFSQAQLEQLGRLEDEMFKDKSEKTINRTWSCLQAMGMLTDIVKVESKLLWKLLDQFSEEPMKFLNEIYKALTGNYVEEEKMRIKYQCHERIILSGMAFLELPKIIKELHKRLPPVEKWSFPPKPKRPSVIMPKKLESPFLEKLRLPFNWRIYKKELAEWHEKCYKTMRPVAILPKKSDADMQQQVMDDRQYTSCQTEVCTKASVADIMSNKVDECELMHESLMNKKLKNAVNNFKKYESKNNHDNVDKKYESNNNHEIIEKKLESKINHDVTDKRYSYQAENSYQGESFYEDTASQQDPYQMKTDWTTPPTPCPYKYRKLLNEKGPLRTDEEFFAELNVEPEKKEYPPGRENLTLNMQHYLFDIEADFYSLTQEADKITGAVDNIMREIHRSENNCDTCCPCRQTKKQYIKWRSTKAPFTVIDGVTASSKKRQVIGAVSLHSPASSLSSLGEPVCFPSSEKIVKNKVVAGATITEDGEVINLIDGATKEIEDVPPECLEPGPEEIRNVPPCDCMGEEEEVDLDLYPNQKKYEEKYEDVCFGKKFRPKENPTYDCPEFNKKEERDMFEDEIDFIDFPYDFEECEDEEGEYEYKAYEFSDVFEKPECEPKIICKPCGRGMKPSCIENFPGMEPKQNRKDKLKCKCESLTEFLRMDITKIKCIKPERQSFKKEGLNFKKSGCKKKQKLSDHNHHHRKHKKSKNNHKKTESKIKEKKEKKGNASPKRLSQSSKKSSKSHSPRASKKIEECPTSEKEEETKIPLEGGPYGYRTASEEALPAELTVAYLVKNHPPEIPADTIPVREGGRPCKCRENRNNRKKLIYNIGALNPCGQAVVEGIHWLTPVPSIRRSEEYIPEYELYDSPYGKARAEGTSPQRCDKKKAKGKAVSKKDKEKIDKEEIRRKDWAKATNDEYLMEFFTKNREGGSSPCGDACPKCRGEEPEPRKLKVMNAVCECKYERKIVKRDEERKNWADRQQRLKAMDKESYLHITEVTKSHGDNDGDKNDEIRENGDQTQLVIADVTMQSPYATPSPSRAHGNLPYEPMKSDRIGGNGATDVKQSLAETNDLLSKQMMKQDVITGKNKISDGKDKISAVDQSRKNSNEDKKHSVNGSNRKKSHNNNDNGNNVRHDNHIEDKMSRDVKSVDLEINRQEKRDSNFYNDLEENLFNLVREELQKMAEEEFVTVKLPNYHKMPQILYWISYRVRGMHFTNKYKKKIMAKSIAIWKEEGEPPKLPVEPLQISDKERKMLNFDYALYWKRKIAKKHVEIYSQLRQEVVAYGRNKWYTMEYGKFPNVLFKQAYFTYFPSREKDAFVYRIDL